MIQSLLVRGVISSDHPERTVEKVSRLIAADLAIEDEITEEARLILIQHQDKLKASEELEYHRLLLKVKAELASKRGYVI